MKQIWKRIKIFQGKSNFMNVRIYKAPYKRIINFYKKNIRLYIVDVNVDVH
jgi:hypothetical protein